MSIKELRCPSCKKTLQRVTSAQGTLLVCTCGHAEDHVEDDEPHGIVHYIQEVGRKTLTQHSEPRC